MTSLGVHMMKSTLTLNIKLVKAQGAEEEVLKKLEIGMDRNWYQQQYEACGFCVRQKLKNPCNTCKINIFGTQESIKPPYVESLKNLIISMYWSEILSN